MNCNTSLKSEWERFGRCGACHSVCNAGVSPALLDDAQCFGRRGRRRYKPLPGNETLHNHVLQCPRRER